MMMGARDD